MQKLKDNDAAETALDEALESLRERMLTELARLDTDSQLQEGSGEQRLKYMALFFKTLQGIEDMIRQMRERRDSGSENGIDVVEFRRQLEIQIERLVDSETEATLSAEPE